MLTTDGLLFAWGFNGNGELGDGTTTDRLSPVAITGALSGKTVVAIADGLALASDGSLYAWGHNDYGTVGDGTTTPRLSPVAVNLNALSGRSIASIHGGGVFKMVRTTDGKLYCWGLGTFGSLGTGSGASSSVPVEIDMTGALAGKSIVAASAGGFSALALAYAPPAPHIVVQNEIGTALTSGTGNVDLGTALSGNTTTRTLTIRNAGTAALNGLVLTTNGANAGDFTADSLGATTLLPNATTTFHITFAPAASGARNAVIHIASNDTNRNPFDIALIGTGGIPITTWRQQNFGNSANTGTAADTADPDHDGVSNLLEFATGGDPNSSGASPGTTFTPPVPGLQDAIEFFYTRNKQAMAELIFQVEWKDTLSSPNWSSAGVTETSLSDDGLTQQVRALVPTNGSDHRYVHLRVTRP